MIIDNAICMKTLESCESPIERRFLEAAIELGWGSKRGRSIIQYSGRPVKQLLQSDNESICVQTRIVCARRRVYKVDFAMVASDRSPGRAIIIECDGHDYHERTKAQAMRDRKRDRALLAIGLPVVRFTGSEIVRNAKRCVREAYALLTALS